MLDHGLVVHNLDQLHYATIFVGQNVAMVHKIGEPNRKAEARRKPNQEENVNPDLHQVNHESLVCNSW